MSRSTLSWGTTPADEDCAQVGTSNYQERAKKEAEIFIRQLERQFGPPPEGAAFRIKSNPHDFGTYYEVALSFDDDNPRAAGYAFKVDEEQAAEWDAQAIQELG
jgi:hypothetical protein